MMNSSPLLLEMDILGITFTGTEESKFYCLNEPPNKENPDHP